MAKFYLDLRSPFVEIDYEIAVIKGYLDLLEKQLPTIVQQEEDRSYAALQEQGFDDDEAERSLVWQQIQDLSDHILPRFFRGPFLITLWSIYEYATSQLAEFIRKNKSITTKMPKKKADLSYLGIAKDYYDNTLNFPLHTDQQIWDQLEKLRVLRNALAHQNGHLEGLKANDRAKIEAWAKDGSGIDIYYRDLVFSESFIRDMLRVVTDALSDVVKRARTLR